MKEINATQQRIYEYLEERMQTGYPPSVREICQAVGLKSTSSVQANLDALERAGYIERDPMLKRSIRLVTNGDDNVTNVPIVGTVTAGMPILAVEQGISSVFGTRFVGQTAFCAQGSGRFHDKRGHFRRRYHCR